MVSMFASDILASVFTSIDHSVIHQIVSALRLIAHDHGLSVVVMKICALILLLIQWICNTSSLTTRCIVEVI